MPVTTGATEFVLPPAPANCPLRIGAPEDFARIRAFLARAGYADDVALCRTLDIPKISDLVRVDWDNTPLDTLPRELDLLLQLFVRAVLAAETELTEVFGAESLAAFLSLGLLQRSERHPGYLMATVWLSPVDGYVAISDLTVNPEGDDFQPFDDAVFPAIEALTLEFLHFMPDAKGGDALDLCGGSGIGALHLARTARLAVSADLTPRSAFFAAFNGLLNDTPIVSGCGDLYTPVAGQQFDLITAHPPYVPEIGRRAIYRDGGEAGETITRRVIEELPRHLRPGGTCVIVGYARDTNAKLFEQRARDWLGTAGQEFDVIFGVDRTQSIEEVAESQRRRLEVDDVAAELRRFSQRLRDLDTRQFSHGVLMMRRKSGPVSTPPLRVRTTAKASPADFERMFAWRERRRQPGFQGWLANTKPRLAPHLELRTRQVVKDGRLVDSEITFEVERELAASLRLERWIVAGVGKLDGRQSVVERFNASHQTGDFPKGFPLEAFTELIDVMIERGFLELDLPA